MAEWVPEFSRVPLQLQDEQRAIEALIRASFKGVRLDGGTSWRQAELDDGIVLSQAELDAWDDVYAAAGVAHADKPWEELVEDGEWHEETVFNVLDARGFRYYMAPAMIRCLRRGGRMFLGNPFAGHPFLDDLQDLMTKDQLATTARFVRFMAKFDTEYEGEDGCYSWQKAYRDIWQQWEKAAREL